MAELFSGGIINSIIDIDNISSLFWARLDGRYVRTQDEIPIAGGVWFTLLNIPITSNDIIQIAVSYNADVMKIRQKWDGLFYPWRSIL